MKQHVRCLLFSAILTITTVGFGWAQPPGNCRPNACPPQMPPRTIERTVNVSVPVPPPLPPACPMPPRCGPFHPPVKYQAPRPVKPARVPVRVNVAVTPQNPTEKRLVPIVFHSPGPIKPLLDQSVGLAGAIVAAPFRIMDMFLPVYHPSLSMPRQRCNQGRNRFPRPVNACGPRPVCAPIKCGPPRMLPAPCPPVQRWAPPGPSVAPLARPAGPQPCQPYLPPRVVEDPEYPCVEPRGLVAGVVNLPFRLFQRARVVGNMNNCAPASRRMR